MSPNTSTTTETLNELDWVRVRAELYEDVKIESFKEKLIRKVGENPMVPIGTLATVGALTFGLWSFSKGDKIMSQYMMRARVAAQGFTILSMVVGFLLLTKNKNV